MNPDSPDSPVSLATPETLREKINPVRTSFVLADRESAQAYLATQFAREKVTYVLADTAAKASEELGKTVWEVRALSTEPYFGTDGTVTYQGLIGGSSHFLCEDGVFFGVPLRMPTTPYSEAYENERARLASEK